MTWALLLLSLVFILYWLFVYSEGAYLGKHAVIGLYDWAASRYDRIKNIYPQDDAEHLALPLLENLSHVTEPLILDVATGTARLPLALLRQWHFHGRVIGLDLSRSMLGVAQKRIHNQSHRASLIRQDAMVLPFPNQRFDAVTCLESLEFLPRPGDALREMVRVLRPGGQFLISNRVGVDALFFPGRVHPTAALEQDLARLGLTEVQSRPWQVHYTLIDARKPAPTATSAPSQNPDE